MERHYGMDWLRIGAFGLLILYHVGMVFVPWNWHVKTAAPLDWVQVPMFAANGWRLALLFVVSGYASRALWRKTPAIGGFLRNRTTRLVIPLLFGAIVVIPPQPWVELVTQHGYGRSFGWFWLHDYFRFGTLGGIVLPTWQHLWFVVYLWLYTLLLAPLLLLPGGARAQAAFDRLFAGPAALILPALWLWLVQVMLFHGQLARHDLVSDLPYHLTYFPAFLFGFALAGSPATLAAIGRLWKPAAIIAVMGFGVFAGILETWPDDREWPRAAVLAFRSARAIHSWAAIVALVGIAHRFWNRDHRLRPMLTEAVFPFYIIHQTIIVVTAFWLLPLRLPPFAEFAILVPATALGCWLFYRLGREAPFLRPLIGLRARMARTAQSARTPAAI